MTKSQKGHLKRLKEKKSKALDLYIQSIRSFNIKAEKKWQYKWTKLSYKIWELEAKWSQNK